MLQMAPVVGSTYLAVLCLLLQVRPSLASRHSGSRRSFRRLWPISWSRTAAVSSPLWALWWNGSKPSRPSYPRPSTRSKVKASINTVHTCIRILHTIHTNSNFGCSMLHVFPPPKYDLLIYIFSLSLSFSIYSISLSFPFLTSSPYGRGG